jgi:hypothetical protein
LRPLSQSQRPGLRIISLLPKEEDEEEDIDKVVEPASKKKKDELKISS